MDFGGSDISRCFHWQLGRSGINMRELDLRQPLDCTLLQDMKEEYCHLDQVSILYIALFYCTCIIGPPTAACLYAASWCNGESIAIIRYECLFFWVHGEWIGAWNKYWHENRFAVHAICLSRALIHTPWTQKKRHLFCKHLFLGPWHVSETRTLGSTS